jgi:hypothetical protein
MNVNVSSEAEKILKAAAQSNGQPVEDYVGALLEKVAREKANGLNLSFADDDDRDPQALDRAIAKMKNRTPEARAAMRERVLKASPEALPIPAGKTIFDMIPSIRGKETDEEVFEALERLS